MNEEDILRDVADSIANLIDAHSFTLRVDATSGITSGITRVEDELAASFMMVLADGSEVTVMVLSK